MTKFSFYPAMCAFNTVICVVSECQTSIYLPGGPQTVCVQPVFNQILMEFFVHLLDIVDIVLETKLLVLNDTHFSFSFVFNIEKYNSLVVDFGC